MPYTHLILELLQNMEGTLYNISQLCKDVQIMTFEYIKPALNSEYMVDLLVISLA